MAHKHSLRVVFFSLSLFAGGMLLSVEPTLAADKVESNLEKALKSGKKQILFAGKESDDVTIKKGVSVTGTSPDRALINGDIKMENGSSLANVTVAGKRVVITVEKGANVTLSNVTVRGGAEVGILTKEGGGTLTVRNSRITKNQKGFYILPGKGLNITGNVVSENKEEGMDVRWATAGTIAGNQFINNGEGGAEIIAGSSRLTLSNNTFAGNKASGLAIQSYAGAGKAPGNVTLRSNTLANNKNFGLTCGSPSSGGAGVAFFRATVKATDNVLRGNGQGSIGPECGVTNRSSVVAEVSSESEVTEEEAKFDEAALREEAKAHFEATVNLLHDQEYLLELTLATYDELTPWSERLTEPVIDESEKLDLVEKIATINQLRDAIIDFPQEFSDDELDTKRQSVVRRSLERMEELRQYFERLQQPVFRLR